MKNILLTLLAIVLTGCGCNYPTPEVKLGDVYIPKGSVLIETSSAGQVYRYRIWCNGHFIYALFYQTDSLGRVIKIWRVD